MIANDMLHPLPATAVRTMVLHVLQNRVRLPKRLNDTINAYLDTSFKLKGFWNASKADPSILAGLLTPKVDRNRDVRTAIVQAWLTLHEKVVEDVDAVLKQQSSASITTDKLVASSREVAARHEDLSPEEAEFLFRTRAAANGISVMTSNNAQGGPRSTSPDATHEVTCGQVSADHLLKEWEQLGPGDPFWDSVPDFMTALASLREQKMAARAEIKAREALTKAWAELRDHCIESIDFFSIPALCFDQIACETETVIAGIVRLRLALERFWQLYIERPASAEAYRKNRTLLDAAEPEVASAVEYLRSLGATNENASEIDLASSALVNAGPAEGGQGLANATQVTGDENPVPLPDVITALTDLTGFVEKLDSVDPGEAAVAPEWLEGGSLAASLNGSQGENASAAPVISCEGQETIPGLPSEMPGVDEEQFQSAPIATNAERDELEIVTQPGTVEEAVDPTALVANTTTVQLPGCSSENRSVLGEQVEVAHACVPAMPTSSAVAPAPALAPSPAVDEWTAFVYQLLEEGEISAAYWLVLGLQAADQEPPLPPALVEVLLSAQSLETDLETASSNIERIACELSQELAPDEQWIAFAASIRPAVYGRARVLTEWLNIPVRLPGLTVLSTAVRELVGLNIMPAREDFAEVVSLARAQEVAENSIRAARQWIEDAPAKCRGIEIWAELINGGPIGRMLQITANNAVSAKAELQEQIAVWSDHRRAEAQIKQRDPKGPRGHAMNDNTRDRLLREIREAVGICRAWYDAVSRAAAADSNWTRKHLLNFRNTLQNASDTISGELGQADSLLAPGIRCVVADQVGRLFMDFGLKINVPVIHSQSPNRPVRLRGLLRCPQVPRAADGSPLPNAVRTIPEHLKRRGGAPFPQRVSLAPISSVRNMCTAKPFLTYCLKPSGRSSGDASHKPWSTPGLGCKTRFVSLSRISHKHTNPAILARKNTNSTIANWPRYGRRS